jgi:uncharacterized protein involved in outer membrane biogenesis
MIAALPKRLVKLFCWLAGIVAVITVFGFFILPPLARGKIEKRLSGALHRNVSIAKLGINPYAMSLTVNGFVVKERDGTETAASFEEIYVNVSLATLLRRAPVLDEIRLVKPYLRIVRNTDKTYNWQDLLEAFMAKPKTDMPPPKFSLNNISIVDGSIEFDDRPEDAKHTVTDIRVRLPFISSLAYATDLTVRPELSARVNGSPVGLKGETKPFKETHETALRIDIDQLHLPKYLDYSPVPLRFRLPSGQLATRLTLTLRTLGRGLRTLTLTGQVNLEHLVLQHADGSPLLSCAALGIDLETLDLVSRRAAVKTIRIEAPEAHIERLQNGSLKVLASLPPSTGEPAPAKPKDAPPPGTAKPFVFSVDEIALVDGTLHLQDDAPARPFKADIENIQLAIKRLGNAPEAQAEVSLRFDTDAKGHMTHTGTLRLTPLAAEGKVNVTGFRLDRLYPYYESAVNLEVADGALDLSTAYALKQEGDTLHATLSGLSADLKSLRLHYPGDQEPLWRVPLMELRDVNVDIARRLVTVGLWATHDAVGHVRRDRDGSTHYGRLIKRIDAAPTPGRPQTSDAPSTEPEWRIDAKRFTLSNLSATIDDHVPPNPVVTRIEQLSAEIENFSNAPGSQVHTSFQATVNQQGSVTLGGPLSTAPLSGRLQVEVKDLGLAPFQPYIDDKVNVTLRGGAASARGNLVVDAPQGKPLQLAYTGMLNVTNFASIDKPTSQDLLKWRSLFLGGIDFHLEPLTFSVNEVALSDFYSRLIIHEDATLNLQKLTVKAAGTAPTEQQPGGKDAPDARSAMAPAGASLLPPNVRIGKITLQGGNLNFSDFFIKPNYSAKLTGVGGTVTEMAPDKTGKVELHGRIDNTAPVEIVGRVNPLATDLFLDITASAKDIELPPLSPYSIKYAGYGIEQGKLSVNVKYFVEHRQLTAENNIYLDQLTFGDKVESPTATELPVLLAVSLLKDRNGVVNVNLPISGSLDDPQFSLGRIIIRVLVSVIVKAATAPFALLARAFGGDEQPAYVEFAAGSAALAAEAKKQLDTLSKALNERPSLKLDIAGRVDPDADREGLKRASLERKVKAQKLKQLTRQGKTFDSVDEVTVQPDEYPALLKAAYGAEKFPKPRNVIGLAKDLPVSEMENLMLTNAQVAEEDLHVLANQRAQVTRDYLIETGKVPADRVFLMAPKLAAEEMQDQGKASRAEFSLK